MVALVKNYSAVSYQDYTPYTLITTAVNFTTQDFNGLMQLRPFYFAIQIDVSP